MFCGFGAVVLLVLVVNANTVRSRNRLHEDLRARVEELRLEAGAAGAYLERLQKQRRERQRQEETLRAELAEAEEEQARLGAKLSGQEKQLRAMRSANRELAGRLKGEAAREKELAAVPGQSGRQLRRFAGEGRRQYLTGLKLGGKRILILVDGSASMLATDVVNVIRLRNMDRQARAASSKWRQVQATVAWLAANLPPESRMQLIVFGPEVRNLSKGKWLETGGENAGKALVRMARLLPGGGTNLEAAFAAAAALSPRPDNIILLTDGLPTFRGDAPGTGSVSGKKRRKFFQRAVRKLPSGVPVNTILFPMEGDPRAALLYWQLGVATHGTMFTPTTDWP
jgi:hypothetical protein